MTTEYHEYYIILQCVIICSEKTAISDEDDSKKTIRSLSLEEMLKSFGIIKRGLQFHESVKMNSSNTYKSRKIFMNSDFFL